MQNNTIFFTVDNFITFYLIYSLVKFPIYELYYLLYNFIFAAFNKHDKNKDYAK